MQKVCIQIQNKSNKRNRCFLLRIRLYTVRFACDLFCKYLFNVWLLLLLSFSHSFFSPINFLISYLAVFVVVSLLRFISFLLLFFFSFFRFELRLPLFTVVVFRFDSRTEVYEPHGFGIAQLCTHSMTLGVQR